MYSREVLASTVTSRKFVIVRSGFANCNNNKSGPRRIFDLWLGLRLWYFTSTQVSQDNSIQPSKQPNTIIHYTNSIHNYATPAACIYPPLGSLVLQPAVSPTAAPIDTTCGIHNFLISYSSAAATVRPCHYDGCFLQCQWRCHSRHCSS